MEETIMTVLTLILGGGIGAAIVAGFNERWKFKAQRKAVKEDREADKVDRTDEICEQVESFQETESKRMENLEKQMAAQSEALKLILLDRILYLGQSYIEQREIAYDDRRRFHAMHDCYHTELGGNGDADLIVEGVDELPLKC